jgi:hypothetical protein
MAGEVPQRWLLVPWSTASRGPSFQLHNPPRLVESLPPVPGSELSSSSGPHDTPSEDHEGRKTEPQAVLKQFVV